MTRVRNPLAAHGRVDPEPFSRQQHGGDGGGGKSDGWHGILQVMVQEDGGETSNWVQPETPRTDARRNLFLR